MDNNDPVVIVGSARTPLGSLLGNLASMSAVELGANAIKAAIKRSGVPSNQISEVIMGCVISAGIGQAPARQAAIHSGLANTVPCSTVNKVCGSGMQAIINAFDKLKSNPNNIIVAGGMESMSNAPYLLERVRAGYRTGHAQVKDAMFLDGLEDAYEKGTLMGVFADRTAEKYHFTRNDQDEFAILSLQRAQKVTSEGLYLNKYEIEPINVQVGKGEQQTISADEHPSRVKIEKIPTLKPAFATNGTVTAANSSAIADGAAALVLMRLSKAKELHLQPLAKILGYGLYSHDPAQYTTAPIYAIKNLLQTTNLSIQDVDLFEINEAFAVVTMAAMKELNLTHDKVNILGGACALGHPIGASGCRIVCTLLNALNHLDKKVGIAALCIGGGEATALAIERI